jgi:hypothetical protein
MTDDLTRDPARDPELAALLRGALGDAPEADWDRLRGSLAARAELPLARLRRDSRPRGLSCRVRTLVPLAAAAGIAGGALAVTLRPGAGTLPQEEEQVVQEIVEASLPESLDAYLTGQAGDQALLEAVVGS